MGQMGERVSCNEGVWADGREGLLRVCGQTGGSSVMRVCGQTGERVF